MTPHDAFVRVGVGSELPADGAAREVMDNQVEDEETTLPGRASSEARLFSF
jgi:hypothetical protein